MLGCVAIALSAVLSPAARGQPYTVLQMFSGMDGSEPMGSVIISGSTLYGTTSVGGANNEGVVFSLTTSAVPEPSAFTFIGAGVIGWFGWVWLRQRIGT